MPSGYAAEMVGIIALVVVIGIGALIMVACGVQMPSVAGIIGIVLASLCFAAFLYLWTTLLWSAFFHFLCRPLSLTSGCARRFSCLRPHRSERYRLDCSDSTRRNRTGCGNQPLSRCLLVPIPPPPQPANNFREATLAEYRQHLVELSVVVEACSKARDKKSCDPALAGRNDQVPLSNTQERRLVRYNWVRTLALAGSNAKMSR